MIAERMTDETVEMKFTELVVEQYDEIEFDNVEDFLIHLFGNPMNNMTDFLVYTYKKDDDGK